MNLIDFNFPNLRFQPSFATISVVHTQDDQNFISRRPFYIKCMYALAMMACFRHNFIIAYTALADQQTNVTASRILN